MMCVYTALPMVEARWTISAANIRGSDAMGTMINRLARQNDPFRMNAEIRTGQNRESIGVYALQLIRAHHSPG